MVVGDYSGDEYDWGVERYFNGVAAGFKLVSSTEIKATVPSGATTGPVVVTTPKGKLTSNKSFTISN